MAPDTLPPPDQALLDRAFRIAEASQRETNPTIRILLEEEALGLWALAHEARRTAMYARGRRV